MGFIVCAPTVPEEGDGDEAGEEDTSWEAHFGFEDAVVGVGHADYGGVGDFGDEDEAGEKADTEGDVDEAGDVGGEAVGADKDGGYGGEEEVEEAVGYGHVEGEEEDDGGEEEHF